MSGLWTFTATHPLDLEFLSLSLYTWPREAAAMGCVSSLKLRKMSLTLLLKIILK